MHTAKYPVVHMLNNPSSNLTSRFLQKMPNNFLGRVRVQAPTKPWKKSHQFLRKWSSYHSWILFFLGGLQTLSKTRATISVHKLNHLFQKEKSGNPSRHDFSYWFEHSWPCIRSHFPMAGSSSERRGSQSGDNATQNTANARTIKSPWTLRRFIPSHATKKSLKSCRVLRLTPPTKKSPRNRKKTTSLCSFQTPSKMVHAFWLPLDSRIPSFVPHHFQEWPKSQAIRSWKSLLLNANHAFFARLSVVRQIDWPDHWQQKPKNIQTNVCTKSWAKLIFIPLIEKIPIMGDTVLYFGINSSP